MPAPIGNEHAKKYDAPKEIKDILKTLEDNPEYLTIGKILEKKPYSYEFIEYWEKKSDIVSRTLKKIKEICKYRLIEKGLWKETSEGMTKFVLVNNHNMKDISKHEFSGDNGQPIKTLNINSEMSSDEAMKVYLDAIKKHD